MKTFRIKTFQEAEIYIIILLFEFYIHLSQKHQVIFTYSAVNVTTK